MDDEFEIVDVRGEWRADVVLDERKVIALPEGFEPRGRASHEIVVDREPDRLAALLICSQDRLHQLVAEEPGPSGDQESLAPHGGELVPQRRPDRVQIGVDHLGGALDLHASTSLRQWNASA